MRKEDVFLNIEKLTETEKKLYDYAVSVNWDIDKMTNRIDNGCYFTLDEYRSLKGCAPSEKITYFIENYKPKDPVMVRLPIEDYNRLRRLELKAEIKRLKKELKGL